MRPRKVDQSKLADGFIVLCVAPRWIHSLVYYSHAALIYPETIPSEPIVTKDSTAWVFGYEAWYSVETGPTGVRDYPFGHWAGRWDLYGVETSDFARKSAVAWAKQHRGQRYGLERLPLIAWETVRRKMGIPAALAPPVCHELVIEAYRAQGVDLAPGIGVPLIDDIAASELTWRIKYD